MIATGTRRRHGEAVTSLVLIPSLVDAVEIPVIAAGGFADEGGSAASPGRRGHAMGTRFMTTKDSPCTATSRSFDRKGRHRHPLRRGSTIYSPRPENGAGAKQIRKGLDLFAAFFNSQDIAKQLHMPYLKLMIGILASGWKNTRQMAYMANGFKAFRLATEEGDLVNGILPVGQVTGLIHDEPTVAEVMDRIVAEAAAVQARLAAKMA